MTVVHPTGTMDMATRTFTTDTRNVHQRKLAVMAKCDVIKPDAQYDAPSKSGGRVQFPYNSIQAISNHIRKFCVEEGLDVTCSGGDVITVELVNADDPKDTILAHWPMVPDDKAWAYSTKFALIRTFLIGDGTEGDEAENATKSGQRRHGYPASGNQSPCLVCAREGLTTAAGSPPVYRLNKFGVWQCDGRLKELNDKGERRWANHPMPLAEGEAFNDPSEIPNA